MNYEFKAILHHASNTNRWYIEIPYKLAQEMQRKEKKGILKYTLALDGYPTKEAKLLRGSLHLMLEVPQDVAQLIGKQPGDELFISLKNGA